MTSLEQVLRALVREEVRLALAEVAPSDLLTIGQAADVARCSAATIRRKVREGALPACGTGKLTRIARRDLEAMLGAPRRRTPPGRALTPEERAEIDEGVRQ